MLKFMDIEFLWFHQKIVTEFLRITNQIKEYKYIIKQSFKCLLPPLKLNLKYKLYQIKVLG